MPRRRARNALTRHGEKCREGVSDTQRLRLQINRQVRSPAARRRRGEHARLWPCTPLPDELTVRRWGEGWIRWPAGAQPCHFERSRENGSPLAATQRVVIVVVLIAGADGFVSRRMQCFMASRVVRAKKTQVHVRECRVGGLPSVQGIVVERLRRMSVCPGQALRDQGRQDQETTQGSVTDRQNRGLHGFYATPLLYSPISLRDKRLGTDPMSTRGEVRPASRRFSQESKAVETLRARS